MIHKVYICYALEHVMIYEIRKLYLFNCLIKNNSRQIR